MKSLIENIKLYLKSSITRIEFIGVEFESETETIIDLKIRFHGRKRFIKDFKNGSDWFEYKSFVLYHDIPQYSNRVKKLSDYSGGKDYEYVLNIIVASFHERPEVRGIWLEKLRSKKLNDILN
jgi:hypothetical protein